MSEPTQRKSKPAKEKEPAGSLTPGQRRAIEALLTRTSRTEAATEAGVSERSLTRWLAQPEFRRELDSAHEEFLRDSCRTLKRQSVQAVKRLVTEMDLEEPNQHRIAAAAKILDYALRFSDAVEVRARVEALESALRQSGALDQNLPGPAPGDSRPAKRS